ncbi:MAG: NFACT family protein, partial [Cyanobacteria bacterium]|nr:NFACT family protein [Cyanobacteriota bacterium]MDW8202598.1 NFACT family protein [Cyanobacteriota bacterium SKYGB_h_bin112]
AAHQVSAQQSRLRPIQTGDPYEPPPRLTEAIPTLEESQSQWQERVTLIPGTLRRNLLKTYRGLSTPLITAMARSASLDPEQSTNTLTGQDWERLWQQWQQWLQQLASQSFQPGWTSTGYTVVGWDISTPVTSIHTLLDEYYSDRLSQQQFQQLHHHLSQKLSGLLAKLRTKADGFQQRLTQADQADQFRNQADLLMAHLHAWQPGMTRITLPDFSTGEPITIPLDPEKNAVQNAQALYKQHQKLRRAQDAIIPLLTAVQAEIHYLEQVEVALMQLEADDHNQNLVALEEIRDELIQQGYLDDTGYTHRRSTPGSEAAFYHYRTPSGFDLYVGRNNRQNDHLTFRVARDYDLWFHTQEIPGSHVLLRPSPGANITDADLQYAADITAYHSRARYSDQVPIVYTAPKHVYKPKGAKPGIAVYRQETVIWGKPCRSQPFSNQTPATIDMTPANYKG